MAEGPFTHVAAARAGGMQRCARCGIALATRKTWPEGVLLVAVGDGRWRQVERPTLRRPVCPLAEAVPLEAVR